MDFSIRRIDSGLIRGPGASKRRKERAHPEFSVDGEPQHPDSEALPERPEPGGDTSVSPMLDDEAGGQLDITA